MNRYLLYLIAICFVIPNLTSCSGTKILPDQAAQNTFLSSGTIIVSQQISSEMKQQAMTSANIPESEPKMFAPLIGYFPPAATYLPAENESWVEILRASKKVLIHKGLSIVAEIQGEGDIPLAPGEYYIQHKQKSPLWYAPDEYFSKRQLEVPAQGDRSRYRRGALGQFAIYPTTTFALHCGPVWTEDVGGLRISSSDLSSVYYTLPVGAPVVVR